MNSCKFKEMLVQYQKDFESNWAIEQQKWIDVKRFQDNYDEDCATNDFCDMISRAFNSADSIVSSAHYYPIEGIKKIAGAYPEETKTAFSRLFDEKADLIVRITEFKDTLIQLKKKSGLDNYTEIHDLRFISALLFFRYPRKYAIYKFSEVKGFSDKFEFGFPFKRGEITSLVDLMNIYDIVIEELRSNGESVLDKYTEKLANNKYYSDPDLHLFVQNLIWYSEKYIGDQKYDVATFQNTSFKPGTLQRSGYHAKVQSSGGKKDYVAAEVENTRVGNCGEDFVVRYETEKLHANHIDAKVERKSVIDDGLGYDILSYDIDRKKIYIEVKTTNGGEHSMFFITATELEAARHYGSAYRLYRVYKENGKYAIAFYTGPEVEALCNAPAKYAVTP